jgi:hypothetical protein
VSEEQAPQPNGNWKDTLPEPLKAAPYIKNAQTVEEVTAALTNAAAWQGNSLRVPGPDSSEEQKAEFRARAMEKIPGLMAVPDPGSEDYSDLFVKLGKPTEADKYKMPEDHSLDGDTVGMLKATAHSMNMTQKQFDAWVGKQIESAATQRQAAEEAVKEQQALIRTEWGAATDTRMAEIKEFLDSESGIPGDLKQAFTEGRLSAEYVKWLYDMTTSMSEGGEISKQKSDDHALTPLEAKERFYELTERLVNMPQTDPRYRDLVLKRAQLAEVMNPQ